MFQKELTLIKQMHQKIVIFVIIGILKMLVINFNRMLVMVIMIYQWWFYELKNTAILNAKCVDYRYVYGIWVEITQLID